MNLHEPITPATFRAAIPQGFAVVKVDESSWLPQGRTLIVADRAGWDAAGEALRELPTWFASELEQLRLSAAAVPRRGPTGEEHHRAFARTLAEAKRVFGGWILPDEMIRRGAWTHDVSRGFE